MDGFLFVVLPIIITLYIQGFSFSHALPAATGKKEEKELFGGTRTPAGTLRSLHPRWFRA
jgi:hypothetical protein